MSSQNRAMEYHGMVALQLLQILRALGRRKFPAFPKDWPLFFAISRTKLGISDAELSGGENSLEMRHTKKTYFQSSDSWGTGNFALCSLDPLDDEGRRLSAFQIWSSNRT